jgi:hypothetical protein
MIGRCGRHGLIALVDDKSMCVLAPERVLLHQRMARLYRQILGNPNAGAIYEGRIILSPSGNDQRNRSCDE